MRIADRQMRNDLCRNCRVGYAADCHTAQRHNLIGEMYADSKIDLVILIRNRVSVYIIEGMEKKNFKNYKIYNTTAEAHADLGDILKAGDTIIFQNDWPDNYF